MDKQVQQQIAQVVEGLAKQLGVAAEHVYSILVRQMVAEGVVFIGIWVIVALILAGGAVFAFRVFLEWSKGDHWDAGWSAGCWLFGAVTLACLSLTFLAEAAENGLKIANPEYYAIKRIADLVK